MAKAMASDAASVACRAALQVHGAIGYTEEHELHLWLKRASPWPARGATRPSTARGSAPRCWAEAQGASPAAGELRSPCTHPRRSVLRGLGGLAGLAAVRPGPGLAATRLGGVSPGGASRRSKLFPRGGLLVHSDLHNHTLISGDAEGLPKPPTGTCAGGAWTSRA